MTKLDILQDASFLLAAKLEDHERAPWLMVIASMAGKHYLYNNISSLFLLGQVLQRISLPKPQYPCSSYAPQHSFSRADTILQICFWQIHKCQNFPFIRDGMCGFAPKSVSWNADLMIWGGGASGRWLGRGVGEPWGMGWVCSWRRLQSSLHPSTCEDTARARLSMNQPPEL